MSARTDAQAGSQVLGVAVLVAAVLQVVAPVVTINGPGTSPGGGSGAELLITPVGWAFSIWGVIYTLAIVHAVAVLVRGSHAVPRRLQIDQLALYLAGVLWIAMAAIDSSVATAGALALMFMAAVDGVLTASRAHTVPPWFSALTRVAVGLYAGWVTAAFFLNLSTALVAVDGAEADGLSWQLAVLVAAVLTLLAVTVVARGVPAYPVAGCWALLGITITAVSNGTTEITVVTVVSATLLIATLIAVEIAGHFMRSDPGHT